MSHLYDSFSGLYTGKQLNQIRRFLALELARSLQALKKQKKPGLSYVSYHFRNERTEKIWGRLGAINQHEIESTNTVFCDLRVGSYRYDNLSNGGLEDNSDREESIDYIYMPAEIKEDAFRFSLWKLTDARFREAVEQYFEKKSREVHYVNAYRNLMARVKREPVKERKYIKHHELDSDYWKYLIRKAGRLLKNFSQIKNSWFELKCQQNQQIFVNSEGREILQQNEIFELRGHLWLLTRNGEGVSQDVVFIEGNVEHLPGEKEFMRIIKDYVQRIITLAEAPVLNSYSGPVFLSPEACGVFFHEVVGHRLEGSRLFLPDDGATFRDLRGKKIIPEYIDIIDNPRQTSFRGRKMIGSFKYDDEGSSAQKAVLVERGILKNFLTTISPVPGQKSVNGHARNQRHEQPISRLGNFFINNHSPVPLKEMKELFLKEIKRQRKPFGIHVKDILGGETDTTSYDFQAFKGEIIYALKVYPDGTEVPIRGVDFVGTPLSALESVICLGDDPEMSNNYCSAESGAIPVSTIAPSMLMRNLELQSKTSQRLTQYILPLPFE